MKPKPWHPEPAHVRQLQALVKRVNELNTLLSQEQNRFDVAQQVVQLSYTDCDRHSKSANRYVMSTDKSPYSATPEAKTPV